MSNLRISERGMQYHPNRHKRWYGAQASFVRLADQQNQELTAGQLPTTATSFDTYGSTPLAGSASEMFNPHGTSSGGSSSMAPEMSGGVISLSDALLAYQSYTSPAKKRKLGGDLSFQWSGLGYRDSVLDAILEGESEITLRNDQNSTPCSLSTLARAAAAATRIRQTPVDMSSVIDENEYYEAQDDDFHFRNDVQRCEAFISAIQACLKICRDNGRADSVARMARKLEKLVDTLHTP